MTYDVLIYGATGHSGEMIARQARKSVKGGRLILAGRSAGRLAKLAAELKLDWRAFRLDDYRTVLNNLAGVKLVVNAAGPFSLTAMPLVRGALEVGAHYVDINGEIDVYMKLDDLARQALYRKVALVCSAGHTAGASCILLHHALKRLETIIEEDEDNRRPARIPVEPVPQVKPGETASLAAPRVRQIGDVRIALSMIPEVSRGSAASGLRLAREQVLMVRRGERVTRDASPQPAMVKWHEPVGRLERLFDFGGLQRAERRPRARQRMTSAANMTDTLVALQLLERGRWFADSITSYLQMDPPQRLAYQLGAMFSPMMTVPALAAPARMLTDIANPERAPAPSGRDQEQVVVLEIDSICHERLFTGRLRTSSGYVYTAKLVVALMREFLVNPTPPIGWQTPAGILYGRGATCDCSELEQFDPEPVR